MAEPAGYAALSAADKTLYGRGSYLVSAVASCSDCHTNPARSFVPGPGFLKINTAKFLTGGAVFGVPPGLDASSKTTRTMSANLLGKTHGFAWDPVKYKSVMTEGKLDIGGKTHMIAFPMPWDNFRKMVDEDLTSIFTYLKTQKTIEGAADKDTQLPAIYCTKDADCDAAAAETCNVATKECVGKTCTKDADCGACQTCTATKCKAPTAGSACTATGI